MANFLSRQLLSNQQKIKKNKLQNKPQISGKTCVALVVDCAANNTKRKPHRGTPSKMAWGAHLNLLLPERQQDNKYKPRI